MADRLTVTLTVNGVDHALNLEPRRTLLDALRHDLDATGTKKVCDMGDCGGCTMLVDGRAVYACLLLALHTCLGPHGSTAAWEGDRLVLWDSTQAIFGVREEVAGKRPLAAA